MSFDQALQRTINGWAGAIPVLDRIMVFLADRSPYVLALVLLWVYFERPMHGSRRPRRRLAVYAGLAAAAGLILAFAAGLIWYRPRPFLVQPAAVHLLVRHGTDSSFPSDHATLAFAITAVLWELGPAWGWLLLVFSGAVALARVYVGVHWPTDVIAGAALGLVMGRIAVALAPRLNPLLDRLLDALGPLGRDDAGPAGAPRGGG